MSSPHKSEPHKTGSVQQPHDRGFLDMDQTQFEIDFCQRVLRATPCNVDVLRVLANHYTTTGQYARGLDVDKQLVRLVPDDQVAWYNLACSYSLTNDRELAIRSLRRSFELGYDDLDHMANDSDLDNIRDDPRYERLLREFAGL